MPRRSRHNLNQWHNALYVSFVATSGVATTGVGSTSAIDRTVQCDGSVGSTSAIDRTVQCDGSVGSTSAIDRTVQCDGSVGREHNNKAVSQSYTDLNFKNSGGH